MATFSVRFPHVGYLKSFGLLLLNDVDVSGGGDGRFGRPDLGSAVVVPRSALPSAVLIYGLWIGLVEPVQHSRLLCATIITQIPVDCDTPRFPLRSVFFRAQVTTN